MTSNKDENGIIFAEVEGFVFYRSFYSSIRKLDDERQLKLYKSIFEFAFEGKETTFEDSALELAFDLIRPNLVKVIKRYLSKKNNPKKKSSCSNNESETNKNEDKTIESEDETNKGKDKDIDKDIDIESDTKKSVSKSNSLTMLSDLYNNTCTNLPQALKHTNKRVRAVNNILKHFNLDEIKRVFEIANSSQFLCGKNNNEWKANFDWLMNEENFTKVLEGQYSRGIEKKTKEDEELERNGVYVE